jgi:hypothetical protein
MYIYIYTYYNHKWVDIALISPGSPGLNRNDKWRSFGFTMGNLVKLPYATDLSPLDLDLCQLLEERLVLLLRQDGVAGDQAVLVEGLLGKVLRGDEILEF